MQITDMSVNDLTPYENNPRRNEHAVKYVANSIKQFGFKVPIVIDKNNVVVAGHTRLMAAKELGLETVPCIRADDLTDEQVKAFRLADNKVSEMSSWDFEALDQELAALDDIDMSRFGFDAAADQELDNIFDDAPDASEPKEPEPKTVTCPHCGETFEL